MTKGASEGEQVTEPYEGEYVLLQEVSQYDALRRETKNVVVEDCMAIVKTRTGTHIVIETHGDNEHSCGFAGRLQLVPSRDGGLVVNTDVGCRVGILWDAQEIRLTSDDPEECSTAECGIATGIVGYKFARTSRRAFVGSRICGRERPWLRAEDARNP